MNVEVTPRAFRELQDIYLYVDERSPRGAAAVMSRFRELFEVLGEQPALGVRAGTRGMRRVSAQPYPYFVFYRIARRGVVVHAIRHAARDPKAMPR